jgi:hypothetical protein
MPSCETDGHVFGERDICVMCKTPKPPSEFPREIERKFMVAVMEADDAFQKAGAAGTKTWIREFLLDRLDAHGLVIGMKSP